MTGGVTRPVLAAIAIAASAVAITTFGTRTSREAVHSGRMPDGHPNFNGVWQALNEANWDLQAHEARPGAVTQPGVYPYEYARYRQRRCWLSAPPAVCRPLSASSEEMGGSRTRPRRQ